MVKDPNLGFVQVGFLDFSIRWRNRCRCQGERCFVSRPARHNALIGWQHRRSCWVVRHRLSGPRSAQFVDLGNVITALPGNDQVGFEHRCEVPDPDESNRQPEALSWLGAGSRCNRRCRPVFLQLPQQRGFQLRVARVMMRWAGHFKRISVSAVIFNESSACERPGNAASARQSKKKNGALAYSSSVIASDKRLPFVFRAGQAKANELMFGEMGKQECLFLQKNHAKLCFRLCQCPPCLIHNEQACLLVLGPAG